LADEGLLDLAVSLAQQAGKLLLDSTGNVSLAGTKTSPTDAVTEVDRASEALLVKGIGSARPDDGILGEEGASVEGTSGIRWVVDPLDGTVNYLYGHPTGWAVSVAAEDEDGSVVGAVYDPPRNETFSAERGSGAFLNGLPIGVSTVTDLAGALVGTGFGYVAPRRAEQAAILQHVLPRIRDVRRAGSAALDLCWAACGRLDAFYELGLGPWDWAAASLVVTEAGGRFSRDDDEMVVAGPPALFDALRSLLGR